MESNFKNVLVFGVGGVGGYFGGKIAYFTNISLSDTCKIGFLARGNHLSEIKNNGLLLKSNEGDLVCKPAFASDKIQDFPTPDLVLLCTKSYALENAVKQLEPFINVHTVILPLLNGVDIYDRVRKVTKKGIVLPSCVYVASHIEKPGVVLQQGSYGNIISGSDPTNPQYNPEQLIQFFQKYNIRFKWTTNPFFAIWEKYIFVASFALVTASKRKTFVEVASDNQLSALVREVMNEIKEVAKAENIILPDNTFESAIEKAQKLPADAKTSFQRDIEKGEQNEGDIFGKTIIEKGKLYGIPTPVIIRLFNEIMYK